MNIKDLSDYLKSYDGKPVTIMEICGSHTAAIEKHAIKSLLSDKIRLISGPGCPVCVTPTSYIDRLIEFSHEKDTCVITFADMLRVPGSKRRSLSDAAHSNGAVTAVYTPLDAVKIAKENPGKKYVFAAVGFETTAPIYTFMIDEMLSENIKNLRLLTSIKTMPEVVLALLDKRKNKGSEGADTIDGFIAPGHVCAVTGADYFSPIAEKCRVPFAVAGFEAKELLIAVSGLVRMIENSEYEVKNFYTSAVENNINERAMQRFEKYYKKSDAVWRGIGTIKGSALILNDEYLCFDAGSSDLTEEDITASGCICGHILTGEKQPEDCPLFNRACTVNDPVGACMVSMEGSCRNHALYAKQ